MANPKKMKDAIDEARKVNGEPPRQKLDKNPLPKPPVKVAAGPVKPSEEAEAVFACLERSAKEDRVITIGKPGEANAPRATEQFLRTLAAAVVRRFPGLTRKPEAPRINYPDRLDAKMAAKGRLPAGSKHEKLWDGEVWRDCLFVPYSPGGGAGQHFRATGPTSFKAEVLADDLYRNWLAEKSPATPTAKETT